MGLRESKGEGMRWAYAGAGALLGAMLVWLWVRSSEEVVPARDENRALPATEFVETSPPGPLPAGLDWILSSGGSEPSSTPISLLQDLESLRQNLPGRGAILFAGGSGSYLQESVHDQPTLREELGELFEPRDRRVHYVPAPTVDGPSSRRFLLESLDAQLASGDEPLFVYLGGHGEGGEIPADALLHMWGGEIVQVDELAAVLQAPRPARLVMTSCFGGGFADVIFDGADADSGLAQADLCGVFATSWDTEASGCDPNPDRRMQGGYALRFAEVASSGDPEVDADGDGMISILEAHTFARLRSISFDVPTTTSERWLRVRAKRASMQRDDAPDSEVSGSEPPFAEPETDEIDLSWLREEQLVIEALGRELNVQDEDSLLRLRTDIERRLEDAELEAEERAERVDEAYYRLRAELLRHWPTLDDAWSRQFDDAISRDAEAISRALRESGPARDLEVVQSAQRTRLERIDEMHVELARVRRLVDAYDAVAFARLVHDVDREGWEGFTRLRTCERSALRPTRGR